MGAATDKIRNIALVGHGGAGKTSLAEAILFVAGETKRFGKVDEGNSILDYDPEETKRKISINLALAPVTHKSHELNIVDTPGYADFMGDAIAGMRAAETALFVVDAVSGPQVQTERLWEIAGDMEVARAIFVNRMDKEHADFESALTGLDQVFGHRVGAVQIPIGSESSFSGVIDVIRMKAYQHGDGQHDSLIDIPPEYRDAADEAREKLVELVAEADDELMEKYLEGETLTQAEVERLLSLAVKQRTFIPVFVGSAAKQIGIDDLLDEVVSFFPSPLDAVPFTTKDGAEVPVTVGGETVAFVFKTVADPYVGHMNFVKLVSGMLKKDSQLVNSRTANKERVGHIYSMKGKETHDVDSVSAGGIAVLPKLAATVTNDTLSDKGTALAPMALPRPLHSVAIQAKTKTDEDRLGTAMNKLVEEESTLDLRRDPETRQTVLSGLGDVQIDVAMQHLKSRFNVDSEVVELRIPYRETIRKVASAQGRHKKQTGGAGQFGDCWLRLEPNPGNGYEFVDEIVGGRIPRQFIPAVDKGVQETLTQGVLAGYPVVDVKAAVYDGSYHSVDSSEIAFKTAARIGFRAAAEKADMVLLEPIANLEILTPETYAGDVMGDMSSRRGKILGMEPRPNGKQLIRASVPYAEVVGYSTLLRSLTHGAGSYTIEVSDYAEVPHDIARKVIDQAKKEREESK